ncbi:hypothetical protein HMPREF3291_05385 [Bacillus sp. HMSC76G11]|nr:hypothetical protein HMPREF3291_05385 [Bacillus sp. HMSC76G11]
MKQLSEYISSFRDGECVYYLNKEGREMVNAKKIRKKTLQARHFIMRNYIYIAYEQPSTWKTEVKVGVKEDKKTSIICDALFERDKRYHIVEVDHMQKMSINRLKVKKYKQLVDYGIFGNTPHFIWITTTDYRKKQLEKYCEDLDCTIFTIKDFN